MNKKQLQNMPYFAGGLALTYLIAKPETIYYIAIWNDYIAFKCLVGFGLSYQGKNLMKWGSVLIKKMKPKPQSQLIFGIELNELVDYLIEYKSFRQVHVKKTFGLAHNKMVKLGKHLESRGVLGRGECNAFVLHEITRSDIVSLLKERGDKVSPLKIVDWRASKIDFNMNVKAI